jgi:PAS domain S-box-containing protein
MSYDIKSFQNRYSLANKDIAEICNCSLPTIQKWRSGEVTVSGAAGQLMKLLDINAEGDPDALRKMLGRMSQAIDPGKGDREAELDELESSMNKVVDRLEYMLESRRKDKELSESEARYRSMVESYDHPVCRWSPDTTLTYVNQAYTRLYRQFGEDLVGKRWLEFLPSDQQSAFMAIVSDLVRRGEEEVSVHQATDAEGRVIQLEWRDIPIKNEQGVVVECHSVAYDVTELVRLRRQEDELKNTKEAFLSLAIRPFVLFDESGRFLETNEVFRREILGQNEWSGFADVLSKAGMGKFKRLLKRIFLEEEFCYQMQVDGRAYRFNGRLLRRSDGESCFLAMAEPLTGEKEKSVVQARLRTEAILDDQQNGASLDKKLLKNAVSRMHELAEAVNVDRVYVFRFDEEEGVFDNIMEWCADGVEAFIDELQGFPMSEYPWWSERIRKHQWIQFEDTSKMPRSAFREREVLTAQSIVSIMVAPVIHDGKAIGFVGFDHNETERIWHDQEHQALKQFSEEMASSYRGLLK